MKIKKGFFILLFVIVFNIHFHYYDSIMVKAEELKITIEHDNQKSKIEEPRTIQIMIEEKEPRTVEIFIAEEEQKKKEIEEVQNNSFNSYGAIVNSLTEQDKELICRIAYLEAGNQCLEGQRAVIEVILNRIIRPEWPNTVEGVLSAPHQFSTWKNKNNVSVEQIAKMYNILNIVSCSKDTILPTNNYVYFNNKNNNSNSIKIQGHWFWK